MCGIVGSLHPTHPSAGREVVARMRDRMAHRPGRDPRDQSENGDEARLNARNNFQKLGSSGG
jgi:hypothetical protein